MKKIAQILGCLTLSAVVLTSCVNNEESEGVKAIREAEARETNATAKAQEIANLRSELALLKEQNEYDATKQTLIDIAIAKKSLDLLNAQIELKEAEIGENNSYILAYTTEIGEIRDEIESINEALYGTDGEGAGYTVTLASINNTITANKATVTANKATIADLDPEIPAQATQIANLKAENALLEAKNVALEAQKVEIEKLIASKKTEITALQARLDKLIAEIAAL